MPLHGAAYLDAPKADGETGAADDEAVHLHGMDEVIVDGQRKSVGEATLVGRAAVHAQ